MWPGGTPGYASWRDAVLRAEDLGADIVFGYDHFHKPFVQRTSEGPRLLPQQADGADCRPYLGRAADPRGGRGVVREGLHGLRVPLRHREITDGLFAEGLERISSRLKLLKPQPVRDIPILVGGAGEKKTLPLHVVGRYASIWHSSLDLETLPPQERSCP